jgi:hypothetical protein
MQWKSSKEPLIVQLAQFDEMHGPSQVLLIPEHSITFNSFFLQFISLKQMC